MPTTYLPPVFSPALAYTDRQLSSQGIPSELYQKPPPPPPEPARNYVFSELPEEAKTKILARTGTQTADKIDDNATPRQANGGGITELLKKVSRQVGEGLSYIANKQEKKEKPVLRLKATQTEMPEPSAPPAIKTIPKGKLEEFIAEREGEPIPEQVTAPVVARRQREAKPQIRGASGRMVADTPANRRRILLKMKQKYIQESQQ